MKDKCCIICGESARECLDWHHINPHNKVDRISRMNKQDKEISLVLEEINKCIVVCSNCHRKIHANNINLAAIGFEPILDPV